VASENGHLEMVQYLVDHGADVDIKDDDGVTDRDYYTCFIAVPSLSVTFTGY